MSQKRSEFRSCYIVPQQLFERKQEFSFEFMSLLVRVFGEPGECLTYSFVIIVTTTFSNRIHFPLTNHICSLYSEQPILKAMGSVTKIGLKLSRWFRVFSGYCIRANVPPPPSEICVVANADCRQNWLPWLC